MSNTEVIILDDEAVITEGVADYLSRKGIPTRGFRLYEALETEIANSPRASVLIVDLRMPGLNGFDVVRRIRERYPSRHFSIIVISGHISASERSLGRQLGINQFMQKPALPARLLDAVVSSLATHHE